MQIEVKAYLWIMPPKDRPNVLFIIVDDHRADALGAMGHPVLQTPALDKLSDEGTLFTNARIMGSLVPAVCAPSRACLLTGQGLFEADAFARCTPRPSNDVPIGEERPTLPQVFREQGYETFLAGKWHNDTASAIRSFESGKNIFHRGMCEHTAVPVQDLKDLIEGRAAQTAEGFSSEVFCDTAIEFIRYRDDERPFFLWLALTSPHDPRTPPPPYDTLYAPDSIPLPANFLPEHPFDNGELDIRDERLAPRPRDPARVRKELADYYGMISHHDACLGRVFDCLRETGQDRDTLIVYVSDHGLAIGSHGLLGKQNLYEHSVRVPLILRGPGVHQGARCAYRMYSLDLFATLCELAGIEAPESLESCSVVPAMQGHPQQPREILPSTYSRIQYSAYDGRWKLIRYLVNGQERLQLFDLKTDPHEQRDRASDPTCAPLIEDLLKHLNAWQQANEAIPAAVS
jgi:arylsulfatase A-like enzyme